MNDSFTLYSHSNMKPYARQH